MKLSRRKRTNRDEEREEKEKHGKYLQCTIHTCMKMPLFNTVPCPVNAYNEMFCFKNKKVCPD